MSQFLHTQSVSRSLCKKVKITVDLQRYKTIVIHIMGHNYNTTFNYRDLNKWPPLHFYSSNADITTPTTVEAFQEAGCNLLPYKLLTKKQFYSVTKTNIIFSENCINVRVKPEAVFYMKCVTLTCPWNLAPLSLHKCIISGIKSWAVASFIMSFRCLCVSLDQFSFNVMTEKACSQR